MLLWISLFGGLALILMTVALVLSMGRAERRARRNLYRSLGLAESTVEFLMERNRDVLTELSYVRRQGEAKIRRDAPLRDRNLAFLNFGQPSADAPGADDDTAEPGHKRPPTSDGHTRH